MEKNNLLWLLEWYASQCDGHWEHGNGVHVGTLDNPGWYLKVSVSETELEDKVFRIVDFDRSDTDWVYCSVENNLFQGFGGLFNLPEMLKIFREWAEGIK